MQGYLVKIYKDYDIESDICVWVYEDLENKTIHTLIGKHIDCNNLNQPDGEDIKDYKYPVVSDIKKIIVENLLDTIYKYYNKRIKI